MTTEPLTLAAKPTLTGDKVLLRPVTVADAAALLALGRDAENRRLTGTHATFTVERLTTWYGTRGERTDRLDLAVVERATGDVIGEVVLNDLDPDNRSCGFRIGLTRPGRGYGTEATRLVLAHAFGTVGLHRVALEVYAFNPRAQRVYEKVGFVREGTLRDALLWAGEWVDSHVMAVLATDWARHRGRP
jgi:RimJ/RimL family protein N-acetyltransferase